MGKARSGLFGYSSKSGDFDQELIEDQRKYGTQWSKKLKPRYTPESLDVEVEGWENAPIGTFSEYRIGIGDEGDRPDKDVLWLAQYYFVPNHFYFPDRQMLAPIGKPLVSLDEPFFCNINNHEIGVYPDSAGHLAMISVLGKKDGDKDYLASGLNLITPLLNQISFQTDQVLPIVQKHWIGLPSGTIQYQKLVEPGRIKLSPRDFTEHEPLTHALSLYRTGLNCNDPAYSFFSFWRAAESVDIEKAKWCRRNNLSVPKLTEEKIPDHKVFAGRVGMKFTKVMDEMRAKYRNSIAHVPGAYENPEIPLFFIPTQVL
ncbi:methylamine utilization protein MauJ [Desulfobotulus mexicanus]|uniref:methylamine utilization protein MauJ n=1 Tax=Desulfobotulus mexicanus TaxID=2586642 RepID=UPI0015D19E30|nr:methylamine utilization protein MauJ [Desulfobotulus mexicanus]